MKAIKNTTLEKELKGLLSNFKHFDVIKGNVSGNSIEVYNRVDESYNSYLYQNDSNKRDEDFNTLLELLEEKYEELDTINA